MIIKQGWSSDQEILGIQQQLKREACQVGRNTVTETLNTENQEPSNCIKTPRIQTQLKKHWQKKKKLL